MQRKIIIYAIILGFSAIASAQSRLDSLSNPIIVKTDLLTMKGQRKDMNNREQLPLGDISKQMFTTPAIIFTGQRKIAIQNR